MSNPKGAVSFDAIIQAEKEERSSSQGDIWQKQTTDQERHERRRKQELDADSGPRQQDHKGITPPISYYEDKPLVSSLSARGCLGSLAIETNWSLTRTTRLLQRSSSTASTTSSRNNNPFTPPRSQRGDNTRSARLASAIETSSQQANVVVAPTSTSRRTAAQGQQGLSIKGKAAGPFVVEASNFAPGTTAADIESALQDDTLDDSGVSGMVSCRIVATSPTVVAEMVFTERYIADRVISTYNNQKADGRVLNLALKRSGRAAGSQQISLAPSKPANELLPDVLTTDDNAMMEDIEMETDAAAAVVYDDHRSRSREQGRKGGSNGRTADDRYAEPQATTTAAHDGYSRDTDRRDRDRDRDRDRERDRDRDRDRYDRSRGDQGRSSYSRRDDGRPVSEQNPSYNSRFSHYGNGVGGGAVGRGSFGGGRGGDFSFSRGSGRMYGGGDNMNMNMNMMRGGGGGPRRGGGSTFFGGGGGGGYRRGY
ncbi:hypothetical protein KCU88_g2831, partial [Aureobasidium melanogenum]